MACRGQRKLTECNIRWVFQRKETKVQVWFHIKNRWDTWERLETSLWLTHTHIVSWRRQRETRGFIQEVNGNQVKPIWAGQNNQCGGNRKKTKQEVQTDSSRSFTRLNRRHVGAEIQILGYLFRYQKIKDVKKLQTSHCQPIKHPVTSWLLR